VYISMQMIALRERESEHIHYIFDNHLVLQYSLTVELIASLGPPQLKTPLSPKKNESTDPPFWMLMMQEKKSAPQLS